MEDFEPGCREFESLRARHKINELDSFGILPSPTFQQISDGMEYLATDWGERRDLANEKPGIAGRLSQAFEEWRGQFSTSILK